jgi:hypothetical protein
MTSPLDRRPPVFIGITLEDDGWWAYCPDCDVIGGPFDTRTKGAHWRGEHLSRVHANPNFYAGHSDAAAARHARSQREYYARLVAARQQP